MTYSEQDEIDILALIKKIWEGRRTIVKWCGIAAIVAIVVIFSTPKEYSVTAILAPESISRTGTASLSSLASLAGVNLSSANTRDAVSPDLYPDIVSSTPFLVELFKMPVSITNKGETQAIDLYTYMHDHQKSPWWGKIISAPFSFVGWVMGLLRGNGDESEEDDSPVDPTHLTRSQTRVASGIAKRIKMNIDSKTYQVKIGVEMQDPQVATDLCSLVLDNLKAYITKYRTDKSRVDLEYTQGLYDEAHEEYYRALQVYSDYMDANQNIIRHRSMTEQTRLRNEMELSFQLYNAMAQQLQTAKAKVQQETPVYAVLQPATYPVRASKPSKMLTLVAFVFLGFFAAVLWICLFKDLFTNHKEQ